MAKPRTLAELEIEVFDWGLELKHCMTVIACEVCPETSNHKCPGNIRIKNRRFGSEHFLAGLKDCYEQKMAA